MVVATLPQVRVLPDAVALAGGLDLVSPPLFVKAGTARFAYNYEPAVGGGYERIGGIERFDGRPSPSAASYVMLRCAAAVSGLAVGDAVNGQTSGATATVAYVSGTDVAVTKITGTFVAAENLREGVTVRGVIADTAPAVDGFVDNTVLASAANLYRADILQVPGSGRIRGLAVLNDTVYAWRNNAGGTALAIYKSSGSGWTAITLYHELAFTAGSSEYAEGSTITQGGTSATVKRVVRESGSWGGGTAAGRLIITAPSGGVFAGGAAAGGGACTLSGASTQITLAPDGRVRTHAYSFTAQLSGRRLYGCDGVNREFEFDGDVLVPISTGMGSIRATSVQCHKGHLFFAYRGSLQHSATGEPYIWSAVFGAAELSSGDTITDLVSISGNETAAALMVLCANAVLVLYGNDTTDWQLTVLSRTSGSSARSAQDCGGVLALDAPGFVRYPPTQSFGNFAWDVTSQPIEPIARGQSAECSVFVAHRSKYRCFFEDGTAVCGFPAGKGTFHWTSIDLGRTIVCAEYAEIAGAPRVFYADTDGWVYEGDVGRSLDGDELTYGLILSQLTQKQPFTIKQYRWVELEVQNASALTLTVGAEFFDGEDAPQPEVPVVAGSYGAGLLFDLRNYDQAYWDVPGVALRRFRVEGQGTCVSYSIGGRSDNELPHTVRAITALYSPRRLAR